MGKVLAGICSLVCAGLLWLVVASASKDEGGRTDLDREAFACEDSGGRMSRGRCVPAKD